MKKFSRKRNAILNALRESKEHPTAEMLYAQLKSEFPDLSLGTVYRNLAMFKEEGVAASVGVVNGQERFDGWTDPHSHFICENCGAVSDIDCKAGQGLCEAVSESFGVRATRYELTFRGLCADCMNG